MNRRRLTAATKCKNTQVENFGDVEMNYLTICTSIGTQGCGEADKNNCATDCTEPMVSIDQIAELETSYFPTIEDKAAKQWVLKKNFWEGVSSVADLEAQGWTIEDQSQSWKGQIDYSKPENVTFESGVGLKITADKIGSCPNETACSGQVRSPLWFSPGDYLEITASVPQQMGLWPALWLVGADSDQGGSWPYHGEIDLLEHGGWRYATSLGYQKGFVYDDNWDYTTAHCRCAFGPGSGDNAVDCGDNGCGCALGDGKHLKWDIEVPNGLTAYNNYGCFWTADGKRLYMFLNGVWQEPSDASQLQVAGNMADPRCGGGWGTPMSVIFNIAVGAYLGGQYETNDLCTGAGNSCWPPPETAQAEWSNNPMIIKCAAIWTACTTSVNQGPFTGTTIPGYYKDKPLNERGCADAYMASPQPRDTPARRCRANTTCRWGRDFDPTSGIAMENNHSDFCCPDVYTDAECQTIWASALTSTADGSITSSLIKNNAGCTPGLRDPYELGLSNYGGSDYYGCCEMGGGAQAYDCLGDWNSDGNWTYQCMHPWDCATEGGECGNSDKKVTCPTCSDPGTGAAVDAKCCLAVTNGGDVSAGDVEYSRDSDGNLRVAQGVDSCAAADPRLCALGAFYEIGPQSTGTRCFGDGTYCWTAASCDNHTWTG